MKKFIIACTAVIIAVTCWMFVSDRIGSTLSFNMNKEVKTFTTSGPASVVEPSVPAGTLGLVT